MAGITRLWAGPGVVNTTGEVIRVDSLERQLMEWIEQSILDAIEERGGRLKPRGEVVIRPAPGVITTVDGYRAGQAQLTVRPRTNVATMLDAEGVRSVLGDGRRKRRTHRRNRGPFLHGVSSGGGVN